MINVLQDPYIINSLLWWLIWLFIFRWLMSIIWVAKDIHHRTDKLWLQLMSIILITIATPLIGLPLYRAMRPVSWLLDTLPRRQSLLTTRLTCRHCQNLNNTDNNFCIYCAKKLQVTCRECQKTYPSIWSYCNHCAAPNIDMPQRGKSK